MPDLMDAVQQLADDNVADALRRHAERPRAVGREWCANADCREAISEVRRLNGAQLCLACQQAEEAEAVHFRRWGGR